MGDIMPSKGLVIHEYRTHGTCSGLDTAEYFAVSRELYERIHVPADLAAADAEFVTSPEEIERGRRWRHATGWPCHRAFTEAHAWLKSEMMAVTCLDGKLLDIGMCFGRDLFPRSCGVNEDHKRLCRGSKIAVPRWCPRCTVARRNGLFETRCGNRILGKMCA